MSEDEDRTTKKISLPCYGIEIELVGAKDSDEFTSGAISSALKEVCEVCGKEECGGGCPQPRSEPEETEYRMKFNAAIDGLEALILAHACAGVDVESPAYLEGIESAVTAIGNNLD